MPSTMNKLYLLLFFVFGVSAFGQQKGISYQAVIINPNEIVAPGYNATAVPLANKAICISFKILNSNNQVEYQESQSITTDSYGMINVVIGTGTVGSGLVSTLEAVAWNQGNIKLVVAVNIEGTCSNYTEISNQILNYAPFSFYALNSDLKDGSITDAKVASGINPAKLGLGNVNNTSDANKPVSSATQTALNLKADVSSLATVATSGDYNDLSNKPITPNPSLTEVTDEFIATASQTSFTLTQTKSVNSKVKMFINGVRISNTAYTVSGNILTYIPASNGGYNLTAGNRIQFDYSY